VTPDVCMAARSEEYKVEKIALLLTRC